MANNKSLGNAKTTKFDEFFTQLSEIEKELRHYKEYFKDKVIFCNCDDPETSNFWLYFQLNFFSFGIKKLVSTHYEKGKESYKLEIIAADIDKSGQMRIPDFVKTPLKGDGDFRSEECIEILKEADIVITNPPFSLFIDYITQLLEYKKQFIIIGNVNALHYKEIFPLIQNNILWLGYKPISGGMDMIIPEKVFNKDKVKKYKINEKGEKIVNVQGICWFTNIETQVRHEEIILFRTYDEESYLKYTNYDAINVDNVNDIPCDYYGCMGVPDSFLQRYNPDQFEIVGLGCGDLAKKIGITKNYRGRTDLAYIKDGKPKCPYSRIIVRRKQYED